MRAQARALDMLSAMALKFAFNTTGPCLQGENIEPWSSWVDVSRDCRQRTHAFVFDGQERLRQVCARNETAGRLFPSHFLARLLARMRRIKECELDVAFLEEMFVLEGGVHSPVGPRSESRADARAAQHDD